MSTPTIEELVETYWLAWNKSGEQDPIVRDDDVFPNIRDGLLAVLDRLKPVVEDAFIAGFLVSGEGYNGEYPHDFCDGETVRKDLLAPSSEFITNVFNQIKGEPAKPSPDGL